MLRVKEDYYVQGGKVTQPPADWSKQQSITSLS